MGREGFRLWPAPNRTERVKNIQSSPWLGQGLSVYYAQRISQSSSGIFFFGAGDINWCLIWSIGSHFPKKIKQTTDGLRRELPKAFSTTTHFPLGSKLQGLTS